jgi:hypothetical protein
MWADQASLSFGVVPASVASVNSEATSCHPSHKKITMHVATGAIRGMYFCSELSMDEQAFRSTFWCDACTI